MTKPTPVKDFEQNLQTLESLVSSLESGELSLEDSLTQFEKGINMTRACQDALLSAEQRVKVLLEDNGEQSLIDLPKPSEE